MYQGARCMYTQQAINVVNALKINNANEFLKNVNVNFPSRNMKSKKSTLVLDVLVENDFKRLFQQSRITTI